MGIYLVMKNNFKRSMNNKVLFILILILPMIVIILTSLTNQISTGAVRIGVILSKSVESYNKVENILSQSQGLQYEIVQEHTMYTDIITGRYHFILIVNQTDSQLNYSILSLSDKGVEELGKMIYHAMKSEVPLMLPKQEIAVSPAQRMSAFLLTLLMITSTLNASLLIRDKFMGTLRRYSYAPRQVGSYIGGNIGYNFIISAVQVSVAFLILYSFGVSLQLSFGRVVLLGMILVSFTSAFGTFLSVLFSSELKANIGASCLAAVFAILGGAFIPYLHMSYFFQRLSVISPIRWMIQLTDSLEIGSNGLDNFLPYVVMGLLTISLFVVSTLMFHHRSNQV